MHIRNAVNYETRNHAQREAQVWTSGANPALWPSEGGLTILDHRCPRRLHPLISWGGERLSIQVSATPETPSSPHSTLKAGDAHRGRRTRGGILHEYPRDPCQGSSPSTMPSAGSVADVSTSKRGSSLFPGVCKLWDVRSLFPPSRGRGISLRKGSKDEVWCATPKLIRPRCP